MSLFEATVAVEKSDSFHMSRLLLLIDSFAGDEQSGSVQGITKLAKLDFLLRYPSNLERALIARGVNPALAEVKDYEKNNVESTMIRFKYGPWDFRYRRFLNLLVAKGLAHIVISGRTVHIGITDKGHRAAERLSDDEYFHDLRSRSRLLKTHFDMGGTSLMRFIYRTFPELTTLKYGEVIGEL
jgi:hypothetical protein